MIICEGKPVTELRGMVAYRKPVAATRAFVPHQPQLGVSRMPFRSRLAEGDQVALVETSGAHGIVLVAGNLPAMSAADRHSCKSGNREVLVQFAFPFRNSAPCHQPEIKCQEDKQ